MFPTSILTEGTHMRIFAGVFKTVIRKPFFVLYMAVVMLAYIIIDAYNPVTAILSGLHMMTGGDIYQDILAVLQYLWTSDILHVIIPSILIACVAGALIFSLIFSGYNEVLKNASNESFNVKGAYFTGLKKNFLRTAFVLFRIFLIIIAVGFVLMLISVPAIVLTKTAAAGRNGLMPAAVFIDILTVLSAFFVAVYFMSFAMLWIPASAGRSKSPLKAARNTARRGFPGICLTYAVFGVLFVLFYSTMSNIYDFNLQMIAKWIFMTLFATVFSVYLFVAFKTYSAGGNNKKTGKWRKRHA
jgi:hypothetical protein